MQRIYEVFQSRDAGRGAQGDLMRDVPGDLMDALGAEVVAEGFRRARREGLDVLSDRVSMRVTPRAAL